LSFVDLDLAGVYGAADDRLNQFYVPVLKEAVAYDRVTGYFRSSALVAAAAGLTHFIRAGARMRVVAGAELSDDDVLALTDGEPLSEVLTRRLLSDPLAGVDVISDHRLEVLAYMAREGLLEIRIGVPTTPSGRPLRRSETDRYFHSKYGILSDSAGNKIAFIGSDNESASGWAVNHETFTLAKSWKSEVWEEQGVDICRRFDNLWTGTPDKGWAVVSLPEAVRQRLIGLAKSGPPVGLDPAEASAKEDENLEKVRLSFVRAAPRINGGTGVGFATAGIDPWPHQMAIARRAVDTFPRSYLLADEVGLGKTIEVGLIVRELLVSGRADRLLLLVPASVLRQWQEELIEKFALDVPRYDGRTFWSASGAEIPSKGNPWRAFPVLLASSHLARRHSRRDELLAAAPWDVVFVDEAHHARRKGSKSNDTPNALLVLLRAMKDANAWRSLYLASATPMQMHAHEAWDLLYLLGLHGLWDGDSAQFVRYYTELREPFSDRDWAFLARMSRDFFADVDASPDPNLEVALREELGLATSHPIRTFADNGMTSAAASALPKHAREWMDRWLRAHTPMHERVFRTSRGMLRRYKADGLLAPGTVIPRRSVRDRFIPMTKDEQELYGRIETYIHRWYDAYRGSTEKKPLGFIMTVYRRRLTSSFQAIEKSLRRRLEVLRQNGTVAGLLDEDDINALEPDAYDDTTLELQAKALAREINELEDFIGALAQRPPDESKMAYLHGELKDAFAGVHNSVIIFTQYTDTMDYVRDQLVPVYGTRIACYSGRGGERWDEVAKKWAPMRKVDLKKLFKAGEKLKILIGTDSLSEGLNLQTCAKVVNYDMPWNFMRVEQRIGRVDRIGGRELVEISNYFYKDTVEEQVYRGIGEDFDWFEDVVGPAQPVLDQVERAIEDLAMEAPGERRTRDVKARVDDIRRLITDANSAPVHVQDLEGTPSYAADSLQPAVTLRQIEEVITQSPSTARQLELDPKIPGAYLLRIGQDVRHITMRKEVLEENAPSVRLLTYGTPEFEHLLDAADVPTIELADGKFLFLGRSITALGELEGADAPIAGLSRSHMTIAEQTGELPFNDRL
jgi:hypothetical protein